MVHHARCSQHFTNGVMTFQSFHSYMHILMNGQKQLSRFVTHPHFSFFVMAEELIRCLVLEKNSCMIDCGCTLIPSKHLLQMYNDTSMPYLQMMCRSSGQNGHLSVAIVMRRPLLTLLLQINTTWHTRDHLNDLMAAKVLSCCVSKEYLVYSIWHHAIDLYLECMFSYSIRCSYS